MTLDKYCREWGHDVLDGECYRCHVKEEELVKAR